MTTLLLPSFLLAFSGVAIAILGIALLIFVHELGHYLACRMTKTRVETFSIGFGPRLLGWERLPGQPRRFTVGRRRMDPSAHAMDFRVSAIPLGGYVKMAGENPGDVRTGSGDEFSSKSIPARAFIVCAGVVMNVIAAAVCYYVAFAGGVEASPPIVGEVASGRPAWRADVRPGDRILEVDGRTLHSFVDLRMEAAFLEADRAVPIRVQRGERILDLVVTPRYVSKEGQVQLGVTQPYALRLEQGERPVRVGPTDAATVAGVWVRGGWEAWRVYEAAVAVGVDPVRVVGPDGTAVEVLLPQERADDQGTGTWRIGIEPLRSLEVEAVRGSLQGVLHAGDLLTGAIVGGEERTLDLLEDVQRLALQTGPERPIEALVVRRSQGPVTVPLRATSPDEAWSLVRDLSLAEGNRVRPTPAGSLSGAGSMRLPSAPALEAGMEAGDRVVAIAGRKVSDFRAVQEAVGRIEGPEPVEVVVSRPTDEGEKELRLQVKPVRLERMEQGHVALESVTEPMAVGALEAVPMALTRTGREIVNIFRTIGALASGNISFNKNVGGPITIVNVSSQAISASMLTFLLILAYISVTLAVLNILPIPVLDGGHLLFLAIEVVKGRPLREETIGKMQLVGMLLLLVLMFFALKNDVLLLTR